MKILSPFKKLFKSDSQTPRATVAELRGERTLAILHVQHAREKVKDLEYSEDPWGPESADLTQAREELRTAKAEVKSLTKELKGAEKHSHARTAEIHADSFDARAAKRSAPAPTLPASPPPPPRDLGPGRSRLTRGR